jgi:SAM-dependent methyltransferase
MVSMNSIKTRLNKMVYFQRGIEALKGLKYSIGAKYYCPVCGRDINHFLPLPKFYSLNAKKYGFCYKLEQAETLNYQAYSCPVCGASDRDRLFALYLQTYFSRMKKDEQISILDIAPSAPLSRYIRKSIAISVLNVSYRTADMEMASVDDKIDVSDMRLYANNHFDFFICSHVLEHVQDDHKALSELYRILKPGGFGILMVPIILGLEKIAEDPFETDESERWRRFGQDDHVRLYSKNGFIDRAKKVGFLVHQYDKMYFGEKLFKQSGITNQSILYIVEK